MHYRKGDRVKHPSKDDWGIGEVLENSRAGVLRVFFIGSGEKTLSLEYIQPIKIKGEDANNTVLDNLKVNKTEKSAKYQTLPQSIELFLEDYPEGFYDEKFTENERDYKETAHHLAVKLLGKEDFDGLLKSEKYAEIVKRTLKIANATNLIFPNEKMSLKDGLKKPEAQQRFCKILYSLLYDDEQAFEDRFVAFCEQLERMQAAKWPIVSYFLFIIHPDKYMFVKPKVTQYSSELCGFEVNYQPQPNWLTYKSVLDFSEYVKTEIAELKPRDMIDVQSFMWCISP